MPTHTICRVVAEKKFDFSSVMGKTSIEEIIFRVQSLYVRQSRNYFI